MEAFPNPTLRHPQPCRQCIPPFYSHSDMCAHQSMPPCSILTTIVGNRSTFSAFKRLSSFPVQRREAAQGVLICDKCCVSNPCYSIVNTPCIYLFRRTAACSLRRVVESDDAHSQQAGRQSYEPRLLHSHVLFEPTNAEPAIVSFTS